MNKIDKGRVALIVVGIIAVILSAVCFLFGTKLIMKVNWWGLTFGILLCLVGLILLLLAIYFICVGLAQVANKGNIKQDNLAMNGTVNVKRCSKCGNELPLKADFCPKCGQTASSCKVCECGAENNIENKRCISCGKEL